MRSGPYSPGEAARLFLLRRLQAGPVAVEQLEAEARREGIARRTLYRVRRRLGLVNRRAWALPESAPQQATVEREEPVRDLIAFHKCGNAPPVPNGTPVENSTPVRNQTPEKESGVVAAAVDSDRRVEQAAAEVGKLIAGGLNRDIAIYRRVCRDNPELAARVREKLAREAADERMGKVRDRIKAAGVTVTPEVDESLRQIAARSAQAEVNR